MNLIYFFSRYDFSVRFNNSNIELVTLDSEKNKIEQLFYKIEGFPTLILNQKGKHITYEGDRSQEDITKFLSENINL